MPLLSSTRVRTETPESKKRAVNSGLHRDASLSSEESSCVAWERNTSQPLSVRAQAEAYMYVTSQNRMRMRLYNVLEDIKRQHAFLPIITCPSESSDFKPRVDWVRFHHTR